MGNPDEDTLATGNAACDPTVEDDEGDAKTVPSSRFVPVSEIVDNDGAGWLLRVLAPRPGIATGMIVTFYSFLRSEALDPVKLQG